MIYILRGLPGSGKTTWAKRQGPAYHIASADSYFERFGGYDFNPHQLPDAHLWCWRIFNSLLRMGRTGIIVDNTNTRLWEIAPYVMAARDFAIDFRLVYFPITVALAAERNVHGVPVETIERMANSFEGPPPFWPQEVIESDF